MHAQRLLSHFTQEPVRQLNGLDDAGELVTDGEIPIMVERVEGKREEIYWEKVPERLRREGVKRLVGITEAEGRDGEYGGRSKRRRRG
jgi:hypothetical protein